MRKLSVLIIAVVAINTGVVLADTKNGRLETPKISAQEAAHLLKLQAAAAKAHAIRRLIQKRARELRSKRKPQRR